MKKTFSILLLLFITIHVNGQDVIKLSGSQSMLITGKGPGQDGAINPYAGQNSLAIVENVGINKMSIRVQQQGKILKTISIKPKETKVIKLLKGHELYFDSETDAAAKIEFRKMPE